MTKQQEILSLLDMSEFAQKVFLVAHDIIKNEKGDKGEAVITESLADLAFRLRDKVPIDIYEEALRKQVWRYCTQQAAKLMIETGNRGPYRRCQKFKSFLLTLTPTEMIAAALLAKEMSQ